MKKLGGVLKDGSLFHSERICRDQVILFVDLDLYVCEIKNIIIFFYVQKRLTITSCKVIFPEKNILMLAKMYFLPCNDYNFNNLSKWLKDVQPWLVFN